MKTLHLAARDTRGLWADAALAAFVMAAIGMLIVPLPTPLLDVLLASNLAIACVLLFSALYVPNALALATLPTLLLITTLYRLALNVSSTRLILLQADAGRVIRAFGDFVVQGNYVVGGVVFVILTLIQYLVIAKGAERVAEVGARFTLDAMPGKQLAIDADLRAGALQVDAARARRAALEQESQFYGAMDGAMKFVKGDAIAGIVIAVISLVGGTAIGVGMHGMPVSASLARYGLLTIGDGLVAQIPSLVISIAAGLVVTRVASREHASSLGRDVASQLFAEPRVLGAAALFLALLGVVPGLPALPFLLVAALFGVAAFARARDQRLLSTRESGARDSEPDFVLELGSELSRSLAARPDAHAALVHAARRHGAMLRDTLGAALPELHVREASTLAPSHYALRLHGAAIHTGTLPNAERIAATLHDELAEALRPRARELLSLDDVRLRLDALATTSPTLVRSVVPDPVSIPLLAAVLRQLLDEGVSVRPLARILEALASDAAKSREPELLAQVARRALRDTLVEPLLEHATLHVHRVDPLIEDALRDAQRLRAPGSPLPLAHDLARDIVARATAAKARNAGSFVCLTQPDVRRALWELLAPELRSLHVLAYPELPADLRVEEREPLTP